jgi:predicted AlkP superfamily pyrophosphatase or phosphodiesterase
MLRRLLVVIVGLTAFSAVFTVSSAAEPRVKKVMLIGIDGLRPDALEAAETPYLDALIKDGAFADDTQILGKRYRRNDTVSGPGWGSILTGVWADKHGVQDNRFRVSYFKKYPDFLRRLKQVRPAAKTALFASWEPIAKDIVMAVDVSKVFTPKDGKAANWVAADRQVAEAAAQHLAEDNPDAVFVYFGLVDGLGHAKGFHPSVPEYIKAIEVVDRFVGAVLRAMAGRKSFAEEDWLVLVTTDHGGKDKDHTRGHKEKEILTVCLIVSGPAAERGKITSPTYIVDAPVTALAHLGVEIDRAWGLDGKVVGLKPK